MPTQARPKESLGRKLDARIERDDCRLYELEKTLRLKVQGVGIMKARLVEAGTTTALLFYFSHWTNRTCYRIECKLGKA